MTHLLYVVVLVVVLHRWLSRIRNINQPKWNSSCIPDRPVAGIVRSRQTPLALQGDLIAVK